MKVLGLILVGLLLSPLLLFICGWAYNPTYGNVVRTSGMSMMEWSSPFSEDKPSGSAKAREGSWRSVIQLQRWKSMRSPTLSTKVLVAFLVGLLVGLLLSICGWAYIATHGNDLRTSGMSMMEWLSAFLDGLSGWFFPVRMEDKIRSYKGMENDPILESKHKIFLSHSGVQKEFADYLCKALEDRFHYPFFDRRPESLPKGEQFPELIVQAAEQCEMFIVVVSEEYFMSKWPMIELNAFINAHKLHNEPQNSNKGPKILPLFYGLSADDLENARMQKKWFRKWETFAKDDQKKRINVKDWKHALDVMRSFNGLPYDKNLKEIVAYQEKIVSYVCKTISPHMRWDDSHVQGKPNMLKVFGEKIKRVGISKQHKVKVVGIHGVSGIGKTTACKTLCNELSSKYEGKVRHIEFPIVPSSVSTEFFQKVLRDLTKKSMDVIQNFDERKCKDILRESLFKNRTFLAIDNILDNDQSMELAKTLLKFPYHPDSLVVVTACSRDILEPLGLDWDAYLEMPDLRKADAMKLFLYHAARGKKNFGDEEKRNISTCVMRCYFSKGEEQGHHYHPLALQTLGLQLGFMGENPSDWVKNLPQMKTSYSEENPVFDILRSSFNLLPPRDQTLFMDLGRFSYFKDHSMDFVIEWLCIEHDQDKKDILERLEHLKHKGLLVDVNSRSGRISIHDLYREFSHLIVKGSLNNSPEMPDKKQLDVDSDDLNELE